MPWFAGRIFAVDEEVILEWRRMAEHDEFEIVQVKISIKIIVYTG